MAQNLSERLQVLASSNPAGIRRANLAVFLALKNEIKTAIEQGWSRRACWELLHAEKRITFSYQAFCRYVRTHEVVEVQTAERPKPPIAVADQQQPAHLVKPLPPSGFNFKAAPNKEELL